MRMNLEQIQNSAVGKLNPTPLSQATPKPRPPLVATNISPRDQQLEKQLHNQVVTWLEQHKGIKVGRARMDKRSNYTCGWPDITFALRGRACAIELKVGRNGLSEEQEWCHIAMRRNGWLVGVCRSLEEVREFVAACAIEG